MEITHRGRSRNAPWLEDEESTFQRVGFVRDLFHIEIVPVGELVEILIVFAVGRGGE